MGEKRVHAEEANIVKGMTITEQRSLYVILICDMEYRWSCLGVYEEDALDQAIQLQEWQVKDGMIREYRLMKFQGKVPKGIIVST